MPMCAERPERPSDNLRLCLYPSRRTAEIRAAVKQEILNGLVPAMSPFSVATIFFPQRTLSFLM